MLGPRVLGRRAGVKEISYKCRLSWILALT